MAVTVVERRAIAGFLVVVCVVAMLLSAIGGVSWLGAGTRIHAEVARIQASGAPVDPAGLERYYSHESASATAQWLRAFSDFETPQFNASTMFIDFREPPPPPGQAWALLGASQSLLFEFRQTISALHQAAATGRTARYPVHFSDGPNSFPPHLIEMRTAAELLAWESLVHGHLERPAEAAEAIHAIFRLAASLENEPLPNSQSVRMLCDCQAQEQIQNLLTSVDFNDRQLSMLQHDLRADYKAAVRRALIGERAVCIHEVGKSTSPWLRSTSGIAWRLTRQHDLDAQLQFFRRAETALDAPWWQAGREITAIEGELKAYDDSPYGLNNYATPSVMYIFRFAQVVTAYNLATDSGIAVERYRRRHGRWPTSWQQLVPDLLPEVPLDPFDGQPLRMKKMRQNEVLIYSVGRNRSDDGGNHEHGFDDPAFKVRRSPQ